MSYLNVSRHHHNDAPSQPKYLDLSVHGALLIIELVVVVGVHLQVVEGELLLDPLLEGLPFLKSQGISLRNNWNNIDDIRQLLEHDDINWFQSVPNGQHLSWLLLHFVSLTHGRMAG